MSYYHLQDSLKPDISISTMSSTTFEGTKSLLTLQRNFMEEKPVQIIDNMIEITENLIKENQIFSIQYKGETFYVRNKNNAIEIFQIEE